MERGEKNARLQRRKKTLLPEEKRWMIQRRLPPPQLQTDDRTNDENYDAGAPNLVPSACPSSDRWFWRSLRT